LYINIFFINNILSVSSILNKKFEIYLMTYEIYDIRFILLEYT